MKHILRKDFRLVLTGTVVVLFITACLSGSAVDILDTFDTGMEPAEHQIAFPNDDDWNYWNNSPDMFAIPSGNIGIGTPNPDAKFQVADGAVLFNGTTGGTPISGAGTRLMWIPEKGAFRAGSVLFSLWDDPYIGLNSFAVGNLTEASGICSAALGYGTDAGGDYATALGAYTDATGDYATAMGLYTEASGSSSTAMGQNTFATGGRSTAMGYWTTASGVGSVAIGGSTTASGLYSIAMGQGIESAGDLSVAIALDDQYGTVVSQDNTMAIMGGDVGIGTISPNSELEVAGTIHSTSGGFKFPDGTLQTTANFSLWSQDGNDIYYKDGNVGIGTDSPVSTLQLIEGAVLFNGTSGSTPTSGAGTRLMWIPEKAAFRVGKVLGSHWDDSNIGEFSVALGYGPVASGKWSASIGPSTRAEGNYSSALGSASEAIGDYSTALGLDNVVNGRASMALGSRMTVDGEYSVGIGIGNVYNTVTLDNVMSIMGGNVGIGTTDPASDLDVAGELRITNQGDGAVLLDLNTERNWQFRQSGTGASTALELASISGGGNKNFIVNTTGRVIVPVIEITGGADLAESFDVQQPEGIQAGMVMSIDPEHPGKLKIADQPYDHCVAGIISGANDIKPGMVMGQSGSIADGEYLVSLTGRVYCWADTENGPIHPGDLLTTSSRPGHAMKVTNYNRAQGAILGKAMSSLEEGQGLILVLAALQ